LGSSCIGAAAGLAAGDATGEATAVVVAGDMAAVAGVMPTAGEMPGTAGLVARAGAVAAAAGDVPGGGGVGTWPKEVNTRVTEQRLAISSVFIGLIGKFVSRLEIPILIPVRLSSMRQGRVQQNFRVCLFDVSDPGGATRLFRIIRPLGM
jgi:hypothetical protein